jgi:Na+/H+ antiporter NhaC
MTSTRRSKSVKLSSAGGRPELDLRGDMAPNVARPQLARAMVPATPPPRAPAVPALHFRGGMAGALAPFALFLGGVAWLALSGAPDEKGFWPILLGALTLGLLLARDRSAYTTAMLDGMSDRTVMLMLCAWLFAGVLGSVLSASGVVTALAQLVQHYGVRGGSYVGAAFLICALVSTATGTSFGTILICGPLLYPPGGAAGAEPAMLMGAILAGATFGDSISPISDTTIASSGSQGVDIGGTVRRRLAIAVPAGLLALAISVVLGNGPVVASDAGSAALDAGLRSLWMLVVPAGVLLLLLRGGELMEGLLFGAFAAIGLGLLLGVLEPSAVLRIDRERFGATGVVVDGMQRAVGVSIFTLLLVALVGTVRAAGVLEQLAAWLARGAQTRSVRTAEGWIIAVVTGAVLLTTHSVVAVLSIGAVASQVGQAAGLDGYRRANLLDVTVCTWPFVLPYFLPPILAASASRSGEAFGMPSLSPWQAGLHNSYAWMLLVLLLISVATGLGRAARPSSAPT